MKSTILVVDDMEINRAVARTIFEKKYRILEAADGEECIEVAKNYMHDIELVLLNLNMPGITGFDILQMRKEGRLFNDVPIVVLTASDDVKSQIEAFELGAVDYITIPFIREIAEYRVRNAIYFSEQLIELEHQRDQMKKRSEHDLMTGLYNKVTAENHIRKSLDDGNYGVIFLFDIDNFKQVNDIKGHDAGDRVITEVARFIKRQFRKGDVVGRIGGDEFIAYMENIRDKEIVCRKAEAIIASLRDRMGNGIEADIGVSVGVAWLPQGRKADYEKVFKTADQAMYEKKRNGKNGYVIMVVE